MDDDILTILQEKYPHFSKGQCRIAQYITQCYDKAAFMTAAKLGKTVGISESTVVRFAVELGFDGYPAMQKAMQETVMNRLTSMQRLEVANDRMGDEDVLSSVLQSDMEKLRRTCETVDRTAFYASVDAIVSAKRVYVIGVRSVAPLASFLGYYLNYMLDNVRTVTASGAADLFEQIVGVGSDDAVIAFSFPRYSSATVKAAQYCRSAGAQVIAVTDRPESPLAQQSGYTICARSDMVSLVDSLTAPLSVVNALIVAIAARKERELHRTFEALEGIWDQYHVYEKRDDRE